MNFCTSVKGVCELIKPAQPTLDVLLNSPLASWDNTKQLRRRAQQFLKSYKNQWYKSWT